MQWISVARLELEQLVHLNNLRRPAELDANLVQDRHQRLIIEGALLFLGRPDYPGTYPLAVRGSNDQVTVDVAGDPSADVEKEVIGVRT